MSRRVGVIVEGPSDKPVVNTLLAKSGINPLIRIAGGAKILSAPFWMVPRLYAEGVEKVIALKDSHCRTDVDAYRHEVMERLRNVQGLEICFVVHAIESWLLGDADAIGKYLGTEVKPVADPEKHCKPEEELGHIFRLSGRSYVKRADAPGIAAMLSGKAVSEHCPSFVEFMKAIHV